jgi:hypothetical protein
MPTMKAIDLGATPVRLDELLQLASEENIILRTAEGREFVLAEVEDLEEETASILQNEELMQLLNERSSDRGVYTLEQVKQKLGLR